MDIVKQTSTELVFQSQPFSSLKNIFVAVNFVWILLLIVGIFTFPLGLVDSFIEVLILFFVFFAIPILLLFCAFIVENLTVEKNIKRMRYQAHSFWGIKFFQQTFYNITAIEVKKHSDDDSEYYELELLSASGKNCTLTRNYKDEQIAQSIAKRIREFLQLPDSQL